MKKGIVYKLSPFNNETDMSALLYVIKKVLAFVLIYVVSAVLGEGVIIGILYAMGYDPLNGIIPDANIGELLPYYGFLIFSLVTLLYCRFVEKKKITFMSFKGIFTDYLLGTLLASGLLVIITGIGCVCDSITFLGFNTDVEVKSLVFWMLAFVIQGYAEEIMCRGFLLNSLKIRISTMPAILISSTVFVFPHLFSLMEEDFVFTVVGIVNLYLISVILSTLVLWRSNIWSACGLHSVWNFVLYAIMGLSLSGSECASEGVFLLQANDTSILNGAEYGMEASMITTVVLGVVAFIMIKRMGRIDNDGI